MSNKRKFSFVYLSVVKTKVFPLTVLPGLVLVEFYFANVRRTSGRKFSDPLTQGTGKRCSKV